MHQDSSEAAQELVNQIELRLSEHSDGILSESNLARELRRFLENYSVVVEEQEVRVTTIHRVKRIIFSTASQTLPLEGQFQEAHA